MLDFIHTMASQMTTWRDHVSLLFAEINLENLTKKGDNNVTDLIKTIFVWAVIIWVVIALFSKQFRMAIYVLVVGGIVGVFIYAPSQIHALGKGILSFFGIS